MGEYNVVFSATEKQVEIGRSCHVGFELLDVFTRLDI